MGLQRVGHDWATSLYFCKMCKSSPCVCTHTRACICALKFMRIHMFLWSWRKEWKHIYHTLNAGYVWELELDGKLRKRFLFFKIFLWFHLLQGRYNAINVSIQFSQSVVSYSLWPHGLQRARLPCPSPPSESAQTPIHWVGDAIHHFILCHPLLFLPSVFLSIRIFSSESVLHIRGAKHWSFSVSINPCIECSGLVAFRIDWLDWLVGSPCSSRDSLKSLLQHHNWKASILVVLSFLYSSPLTSIHDCWKNHSFN